MQLIDACIRSMSNSILPSDLLGKFQPLGQKSRNYCHALKYVKHLSLAYKGRKIARENTHRYLTSLSSLAKARRNGKKNHRYLIILHLIAI